MGEYCWMLLNMLENVWINCSDYTRVLNRPYHLSYLQSFDYTSCIKYVRVPNMWGDSYNIIIVIVTDDIILRILACLIYTSRHSAQLTILSLLNTS